MFDLNPTIQNKALDQSHDPKGNSDHASKTASMDDENHEKNEVLRQFCVFKAGEEEYAIPIDMIKEIVKFSEPAPIPQMPSYILGMSNVRGNIYGVMDLGCFFKGILINESRKYLLVLDHEEYKMAIVIQDVPSSLLVREDQIEQINIKSSNSVFGQSFLQKIIKIDNRMIILINVIDMIASEKFTQPTEQTINIDQ